MRYDLEELLAPGAPRGEAPCRLTLKGLGGTPSLTLGSPSLAALKGRSGSSPAPRRGERRFAGVWGGLGGMPSAPQGLGGIPNAVP